MVEDASCAQQPAQPVPGPAQPGYRSPGWGTATTAQWLAIWGQVIGKKAMRALLAEQEAVDRYESVLSRLRKR